MYTVEYLKLDGGRPVVVDRINGRFESESDAQGHAMVLFATMQSTHGAAGFHILEDGEREVASVFPGRGA